MPIVDILSEVEQLNLYAMTKHPGFPVLEKLHMILCDSINKELLKLDMSSEGYKRQLKALHLKAQVYNEFSLLILKSCFWGAEREKAQELDKEPEQKSEQNLISTQNPILQKVMKNYEPRINAGNTND